MLHAANIAHRHQLKNSNPLQCNRRNRGKLFDRLQYCPLNYLDRLERLCSLLHSSLSNNLQYIRPYYINKRHTKIRCCEKSRLVVIRKAQNPLHQFPRSKSVTRWRLSRNKSATSLQQVGSFPVYGEVTEQLV